MKKKFGSAPVEEGVLLFTGTPSQARTDNEAERLILSSAKNSLYG